MNKLQFSVLFAAFQGHCSPPLTAEQSGFSAEEVQREISALTQQGLLEPGGSLTEAGVLALAPYRVDNAIIMAAGESRRCKPLSDILPKGLFRVRGEVLIEREIRQLQAAGVEQIVVVTGYKSELFSYLAGKYHVILVKNEEYASKNNVASIYAAREYLGNSYICCADNWYAENIFHPYEYESFYTCAYTGEYADEYCITENADGYIERIRRGGAEQWFTIGANFWTGSFSRKFAALLEQEYDNPAIWNLLIDDFHIRHFSLLPITASKTAPGTVLEFDTLEEFEAFDPQFSAYARELIADNLYGRYKGVTRYAGVKTDILRGRLHFNENLWGPSPRALGPLHSAGADELYLYDSRERDILVEELSQKYAIGYDNLFLHNSASEIVRSIMTIMVGEQDNVLLPMPHWSYYPGVVDYRFGTKSFYRFIEEGDKCYHDVEDLMAIAAREHSRLIVVTSPAMPSGNLISPKDLERIVKYNPQALVLVDQAYFGFEEDPIDVNAFIQKYDNVMFCRTFSKFFALAGLRLGYGIASKRAMEALWLDLPLLRLPVIARKAVIECLRDDAYYDQIRQEIHGVKEWFYKELSSMENIHPYHTDTNFLYMKVIGIDAAILREDMIRKGYIYRIFEYGGEQYYRINVAPMDVMSDFMDTFRQTVGEIKARAEG